MSPLDGGGEVVHYLARHGESRGGKSGDHQRGAAAEVRTTANPGGLPKDVFDGLQAQLAASEPFYYDCPLDRSMFNRPGANRLRHDLELVAPGHDGRRKGDL